MAELMLIYETYEYAEYQYYPECEDEFGILVVDKETGEVMVKKWANVPADQWYIEQCGNRLKDFQRLGIYPERHCMEWN